MRLDKTLFKIIIISTLFYILNILFFQYINFHTIYTHKSEDPVSYELAAEYLYQEGRAHLTRPYFFPLLLGLPYLFKATSHTLDVVAYFEQFLFWLLTVIFFYKSAKLILCPKKSFIFTLLFLSFVGNLILSTQKYSEPLFGLLLIISCYFLLKFQIFKENKYILFSFISCCFSAVTRPTTAPIVDLVLILLLFYFVFLKKYWIFGIKILLSWCLIIGFQLVLMKKTHNTWRISNIGGSTYYLYLGAYSEIFDKANTWEAKTALYRVEKIRRLHEIPNISWWMNQPDTIKTNWDSVQNVFKQDFYKQLTQQPKSLILSYARSIISNSRSGIAKDYYPEGKAFPYELKYQFIRYFTAIQSGLIMLLLCTLCFVIFCSNKYRKNIYCLFIVFTSSYIVLISGISFAEGGRFHQPIIPLVLLLCIYIAQDYKINIANTLKRFFL